MPSLTSPFRRVGRLVADQVGRLPAALERLAGEVRAAIARAVGQATGEAAREALRVILDGPPERPRHDRPEDRDSGWGQQRAPYLAGPARLRTVRPRPLRTRPRRRRPGRRAPPPLRRQRPGAAHRPAGGGACGRLAQQSPQVVISGTKGTDVQVRLPRWPSPTVVSPWFHRGLPWFAAVADPVRRLRRGRAGVFGPVSAKSLPKVCHNEAARRRRHLAIRTISNSELCPTVRKGLSGELCHEAAVELGVAIGSFVSQVIDKKPLARRPVAAGPWRWRHEGRKVCHGLPNWGAGPLPRAGPAGGNSRGRAGETTRG